MIIEFWTWMTQSLLVGDNILNSLRTDYYCAPFFQLFLVVLALGVIIKYIINPVIAPGSDKARRKEEKE